MEGVEGCARGGLGPRFFCWRMETGYQVEEGGELFFEYHCWISEELLGVEVVVYQVKVGLLAGSSCQMEEGSLVEGEAGSHKEAGHDRRTDLLADLH